MVGDSLIVCGATAIAEGGVMGVGLLKGAWGDVSDAQPRMSAYTLNGCLLEVWLV